MEPQTLANLFGCPVCKETRSYGGKRMVFWWMPSAEPEIVKDDYDGKRLFLGGHDFVSIPSKLIKDTSESTCKIWYPQGKKKDEGI